MSNTSNNPYPPDLNDNNSNVSVSKNDVADRQFPDNFNPVKQPKPEKSNWHWLQVSIVCVLKLLVFIIAVYLSWNCNQKEPLLLKVLISTLAGLFSEFYIIFYAVYRIYLGNKCPI